MVNHYSWFGNDLDVCPPPTLHHTILMVVSTKMEATFRNHSTGQETIIDLNGDFWGGAADLSIQGGPVIAQITRDAFSAREIFSNSQQVCPPVVIEKELAE